MRCSMEPIIEELQTYKQQEPAHRTIEGNVPESIRIKIRRDQSDQGGRGQFAEDGPKADSERTDRIFQLIRLTGSV